MNVELWRRAPLATLCFGMLAARLQPSIQKSSALPQPKRTSSGLYSQEEEESEQEPRLARHQHLLHPATTAARLDLQVAALLLAHEDHLFALAQGRDRRR